MTLKISLANNIFDPTEEKTDLWVRDIFNNKKNGTFIEGGAGGYSNCISLEKQLGWIGVAIEPHTFSFEKIKHIRKNPLNKCLYSYTGTVDYLECYEKIIGKTNSYANQWDTSYLSGIPDHINTIHKEEVFKFGKLVKKDCITLEDVIIQYKLPDTIDFLMLDIEGAEKEVLKVFPFNKYKFNSMCIEGGHEYSEFLYNHNYIMVENPFRTPNTQFTEYCFIHKSLSPIYKYKIYSLEEAKQDFNIIPGGIYYSKR